MHFVDSGHTGHYLAFSFMQKSGKTHFIVLKFNLAICAGLCINMKTTHTHKNQDLFVKNVILFVLRNFGGRHGFFYNL